MQLWHHELKQAPGETEKTEQNHVKNSTVLHIQSYLM